MVHRVCLHCFLLLLCLWQGQCTNAPNKGCLEHPDALGSLYLKLYLKLIPITVPLLSCKNCSFPGLLYTGIMFDLKLPQTQLKQTKFYSHYWKLVCGPWVLGCLDTRGRRRENVPLALQTIICSKSLYVYASFYYSYNLLFCKQ